MAKPQFNTDIAIIGGGLAGKTAAIALARAGLNITLCAPKSDIKDNRTTALLMDSVDFLRKIEIWDTISADAHPLKTMRIVDGTNRLFKIPQADFVAQEIGLEAFGYNVLNHTFGQTLDNIIKKETDIQIVNAKVDEIAFEDELIHIVLAENLPSITAGFIVGADGRNSLVRQTVKAGERTWDYPQSAISLDFNHQHPSNYISTEFHTETGPFTIVPRENNMAGLVWMEKPERAKEVVELPYNELNLLLEKTMHSYLGKIEVITNPQVFPMGGLVANTFGNKNWALIGEAAHVFPPIGAQGFNLGIRDIETLVDVMGRFTTTEDRGRQYHLARTADINTRTYGVDLLNRSLISDFLPVQLMRGIGLHALVSFAPLRKIAMQMGISPQTKPTIKSN